MRKKKIDYTTEHLFDDRVEMACKEWDAHVLDLEDNDAEILTIGEWEIDDDPNTLSRVFTYETNLPYDDDNTDLEQIQEDIFYVKFKDNSAEIISHYIESEQ